PLAHARGKRGGVLGRPSPTLARVELTLPGATWGTKGASSEVLPRGAEVRATVGSRVWRISLRGGHGASFEVPVGAMDEVVRLTTQVPGVLARVRARVLGRDWSR